MAYTTVGTEGKVTSWAGTFNAALLAAITPAQVTIAMTSDETDVTGLDIDVASHLPGLKAWTASMRGTAFTTAKHGSAGLLTFSAGGYALHVESATLDIETAYGPHENTGWLSTPPEWREYRPDAVRGRFGFVCKVDSSTAIVPPHDSNDTLPTLTFRYGDNTVDETVAGAVILNAAGLTVNRGEINRVTYGGVFTGAITPAGTASIFGASAFTVPEWPQGTPGATSLVVASLAGSKTYTGDAFWTRLGLAWGVTGAVEVSADLQGTGALTIA